ncbi:MAG: outer membrane protein assembly factor BamD, partial [bacterium]
MILKNYCKFIIILLIFCVIKTSVSFPQINNENADFNYGKELYDDHLYDLASIQFSEFLQKYPSSPQIPTASFLLAESYFASNKISEAKESYIKFIINFPGDKNI